jgi:hypothetical protein
VGNAEQVIKEKTAPEVLERIKTRNRRLRIINDNLYVRMAGVGDPFRCWDSGGNRVVYIPKRDWKRSSPALRKTDICVIAGITARTFKKYKAELGIVGKRGKVGVPTHELPSYYRHVYYSIDDAVDIIRSVQKYDMISEAEFRALMARGLMTYILLEDGSFVPAWQETV